MNAPTQVSFVIGRPEELRLFTRLMQPLAGFWLVRVEDLCGSYACLEVGMEFTAQFAPLGYTSDFWTEDRLALSRFMGSLLLISELGSKDRVVVLDTGYFYQKLHSELERLLVEKVVLLLPKGTVVKEIPSLFPSDGTIVALRSKECKYSARVRILSQFQTILWTPGGITPELLKERLRTSG